MIKITYKLILLLSLLAMTVTSFAASEAEYGKVSKAWTLHADGSQEYRSSMELTLFTHTAMNSTYGEEFYRLYKSRFPNTEDSLILYEAERRYDRKRHPRTPSWRSCPPFRRRRSGL